MSRVEKLRRIRSSATVVLKMCTPNSTFGQVFLIRARGCHTKHDLNRKSWATSNLTAVARDNNIGGTDLLMLPPDRNDGFTDKCDDAPAMCSLGPKSSEDLESSTEPFQSELTPVDWSPRSREFKARASYYADLVWSASNLLFFIAWIKFKNQLFSETFLNQGFCNEEPAALPWKTQRLCFRFDFFAAIALGMVGTAWRLPLNKSTAVAWGNGVLYPAAHGLAHLAVYYGVLPPHQNIESPLEVVSFAFILLMGPVGVYGNLKKRGWTAPKSLLVCTALEMLMLWLFLTFFRKGVYILLYINVSINFVLMGSRLLLFGPAAVEERLEVFGPNVYSLLAAVSLVIIIMWIEPTQCDSWFAGVGGHFWFDVSLAVMGATAFWNVLQSKSSKVPH